MARLATVFHTLRHLRWRQWWYRGWHPLIKRFSRPVSGWPKFDPAPATLTGWPVPASFDPDGNTFTFVNRPHRFGRRIDWFFKGEGPLWTFNLQYFEWLYDERLHISDRLITVDAFCRDTAPGRTMHAYPTSLRLFAWIYFDARHNVLTATQRARLHQDADWLRRFPEYQLDGNHLFENALALCAAGVYCGDDRLIGSGEGLLRRCVRDQICADGAHCEGSPMYHSLLLWRILQCLELARHTRHHAVVALLEGAAARMLGWLNAVCFKDGTWPAVNDSAPGIAPPAPVLYEAAKRLGLQIADTPLSDSGYRMIRMPEFELFIDVGGIAPDWQPGHAHADTGSFCLRIRGRDIVVDSGCSGYEDAPVRAWERGTAAHNTPVLGGKNSSELWSRFRVGRRCRILGLEESAGHIVLRYGDASGNSLEREFCWDGRGVVIRDTFPGGISAVRIPLHFAPGLDVDTHAIPGFARLVYENVAEVRIQKAYMSIGFNKTTTSACLLLAPAQRTSSVFIATGDK